MVVHVTCVALVLLAVLQGLYPALDRLALDFAFGLAERVSVRIDALLAGLAVLPDLIAFRYPGQAQPVGQDLLDEGPVRQAIGKGHQNCGALLGEAEHTGFPPDKATWQLRSSSASAGTTSIDPCLHLLHAQPVTGAVVQRQNIQFAA